VCVCMCVCVCLSYFQTHQFHLFVLDRNSLIHERFLVVLRRRRVLGRMLPPFDAPFENVIAQIWSYVGPSTQGSSCCEFTVGANLSVPNDHLARLDAVAGSLMNSCCNCISSSSGPTPRPLIVYVYVYVWECVRDSCASKRERSGFVC
jgi:hypothetical protein